MGVQKTSSPAQVKAALASKGINISISAAPSTLLDFKARGLEAVARASVHYYNTEHEINMFVDELRQLSMSDNHPN